VLGEAMHQKDGRTFTMVAEMNRNVVELDALMLPFIEV
jgi:hypothetical protein